MKLKDWIIDKTVTKLINIWIHIRIIELHVH